MTTTEDIKINNRKMWGIKVDKKDLKYVLDQFPFIEPKDIGKLFEVSVSTGYYHIDRYNKGDYLHLPLPTPERVEELTQMVEDYAAVYYPHYIPSDVDVRKATEEEIKEAENRADRVQRFEQRVLKGIKLRNAMQEAKEKVDNPPAIASHPLKTGLITETEKENSLSSQTHHTISERVPPRAISLNLQEASYTDLVNFVGMVHHHIVEGFTYNINISLERLEK